MGDGCEWCEKRAVYRIRVPHELEDGRPYERFACGQHFFKTRRLVELDFGRRLSQIGAEITHDPSGEFPESSIPQAG